MLMMSSNYLKDERGVALVIEVVLVAAVLVLAGFGVVANMHRQSQFANKPGPTPTPSAKPSPSPSPSATPVALAQAVYPPEKLKVSYPAGWTAAIDKISGYLHITKPSGAGHYEIWVGDYVPREASGYANTKDFKPISAFTFNQHPAYLIEDQAAGMYELSACAAPNFCFFKSTVTPADSVFAYVTYSMPGAQSELALPTNDAPALAQAKQILSSLSY